VDWIKEILLIKEKLAGNGFTDTVTRITNAQMILGTPGEMYLEVMDVLLSLKKQFPNQYELVEEHIKTLLHYGRSINYFNPPDD
jgi:hypothetical protein